MEQIKYQVRPYMLQRCLAILNIREQTRKIKVFIPNYDPTTNKLASKLKNIHITIKDQLKI